MLEEQYLSKHYRDKVGVDDLTLRAPPGAATGVLCPHGAGHSTTRRRRVQKSST
jgi:ABC-type multidrug transport system ATPase subunit